MAAATGAAAEVALTLLEAIPASRPPAGRGVDRVVVIHDFCDPHGGATLLAVLEAKALARRGYRVTFLSGDMGVNPDLTDAGVEIVSLGEIPTREANPASMVLKALYNRPAARFLAGWIAANDTPATVYHMHNWSQILSPAALQALAPVRDRMVISAHDFFHVCPNGSFSFLKTGEVCGLKPMSFGCISANCDRKNYGFKLWRVARQAMRNALFDTRSTVPILAIHEKMRPFFVRAGVPADRVVTVPNPVTPFTDERIAAERNDELIFIGRMEATKGPDLAAAAARRAGVRMRFIGGGKLLEPLRAEYPEFAFSGFLPRDEIPALLARARAVIMPSRYPEPYGLVAVEALWSGLPIIIADSAFLAEDIERTGAGIACDPYDPDALEAAIRTLFQDDSTAHRYSLAAQQRTTMLGNRPDAWVSAVEAVLLERLHGARAAGATAKI